MTKKYHSDEADVVEQNLELISKIYQSFEALEETLGRLKLEEPLFITYIAKKSFANVIFNDIKKEFRFRQPITPAYGIKKTHISTVFC